MAGQQPGLKIREFAKRFGVSGKSVSRWIGQAQFRVVERRTARGHLSKRIALPTEKEVLALPKDHPVKKAYCPLDVADLFRMMDAYPPSLLEKALSVSVELKQRKNVLWYDRNDFVTMWASRPRIYGLNERQRELLLLVLALQEARPGEPPSDRDVWAAWKDSRPRASRVTFWRDMKQRTLQRFLRRPLTLNDEQVELNEKDILQDGLRINKAKHSDPHYDTKSYLNGKRRLLPEEKQAVLEKLRAKKKREDAFPDVS